MLYRFKRRFSSTSKKYDSVSTLDTDETFNESNLLLSSPLQPKAVHVPLDDEAHEYNVELPSNNTEPLVPTISQLTPRPDNSSSRFFSLPTELLLQLQPYLPACTEVSLRQSCSRFFHIYTYPSFYLAGDSRFTFLCHLERDDRSPSRNRTSFVCGHCLDLHARSAFPSWELRKLPQERDCRQVWLCPHRALGLEKALHRIRAVETLLCVENLDPCSKCKPWIRNRLVTDTPGQSAYTPASEVDLSNSSITGETLLVSKIGILQKPSPSPSDARSSGSSLNTEIFTTKELATALSGLDFRICPHIRLGDPYILSKYCRSCLNVRILRPEAKGPPCISLNNGGERAGKCQGRCYVKGCKTSFMFQTRESLLPDVTGRKQIWLILAIYRWLGPLIVAKTDVDGNAEGERTEAGSTVARSHENRMWIDHTVDAAEMVEMRARWKTWLREYGKKCMPDWSICQLHPEDFGLR